jgi:hypothetical protein
MAAALDRGVYRTERHGMSDHEKRLVEGPQTLGRNPRYSGKCHWSITTVPKAKHSQHHWKLI